MRTQEYKLNDELDLTNMTMEPHGARNVEMCHSDFRRRFLNKYGQCTKFLADMVAVETTCKAIAKTLDEEVQDEVIAIVYGINVLKFDSIRDLTVDKVNNCYMDAAMDATKRLSTCVDIYYKNKDASINHEEISGDGEQSGTNNSGVVVRFQQEEDMSYSEENIVPTISLVGNVTGNINVTITPKFCSLKNFKSNPVQVINADTVYELPVHTLAEINDEISQLICVPEAVGTIYLEIRVNGSLVKTLSLNVQDASNVTFVENTSSETLTTGNAFIETGFVFEGELQKPASVTVTPYNCTISGLFSDPDMKLLANSKYRFVANTVDIINQELSGITVVPQSAGNCRIVVECLNTVAEISHEVEDPVIVPDEDITLDINSSVKPSVLVGVKTAIPPIIATGTINKTIKVTVQSTNCTVSGYASDPDAQYASNSQYVFYVSDVDTLNTELAKLTVLCGASGRCSLKVTYGPNNDYVIFDFTVSRDLINVIVPVIDTCDNLVLDVEVGIKPIDFRGRMEKEDASIIVTPTNCRIRGVYTNPGEIYTHERPYEFTGHSLEEFNQEFEHLYVTALRNENVSIAIEIVEDHSTSVYEFTVSNSEPDSGNISSMVTVTSAHLDDELYVGETSNPFDLIFSGLDGVRNVNVKVTPRNCSLSGLKGSSNTFNSGQTYEFVAADSAAMIHEFNDIMIAPTQSTSVQLEVQIDELTYTLEFTNVKVRS